MVISSIAAVLLAGAAATPVTVEIVASGHIETPAQKYRLAASLNVCAPSQAEADRLLASKVAKIDAGLRAMGVVPAAPVNGGTSLSNLLGQMGAGKGSTYCPDQEATEAVSAAADDQPVADDIVGSSDTAEATVADVPQFNANRRFSFDAPTAAAADKAIVFLTANGAKPGDKAIPMLTDELAAKRAAKQQALTKARAEADSYAALVGGKAVLTRISERQELGQQSIDLMSQIFRSFVGRDGGQADSVATDVSITVEFALDGAR